MPGALRRAVWRLMDLRESLDVGKISMGIMLRRRRREMGMRWWLEKVRN